MKKLYSFHTNRTLIEVTGLSAFRDLRIKYIPSMESQTLEQFSSLKSYYLVDPIIGLNPISNYPSVNLDNHLKKIFSEIFGEQLSGKGIPVEHWPDINDYEVFKSFFKITLRCLCADFGTEPLVTVKQNHPE